MKRSLLCTLAAAILSAASCRGPEGPAGPAGPGPESLTDPAIMPAVIFTYPPANSTGPYENFTYQIQVRFNKIMDLPSLKRSLSFESPTGTLRVDTTNITSFGWDVIVLSIRDSARYQYPAIWTVGSQYALNIGSSATDINGNRLVPGFTMRFEPEPGFRIKSISPLNGARDVPQDYSSLRLRFNSLVDTSLFSSISLSPPIPGNWRSTYDSTEIVFDRHAGYYLKENTTYTVTIPAGARDKQGNVLPQPFASSFSTAAFRFSYSYPADGAVGINPAAAITVYFSAFLDTSTIRRAFRILPEEEGSLYFYGPSRLFSWYPPAIGLLSDILYAVTVDTSIRSKEGSRLPGTVIYSFRTAPFGFDYTSPEDGEIDVPRTGFYIYLRCNTAIDTGSVASSISILGMAWRAESSDYRIRIYPTSALLPANTTYTVTVSTGLRSIRGSHLKQPYSFSFTTGN